MTSATANSPDLAQAPDLVLADWIATTSAGWLGGVSDEITRCLFDTLGCAIAARDHPVRHAIARLHPGDLSDWARPGSDEVASAGSAALVNATAAHALDFDDVLLSGRSHASAVLIPTVLAIGDALGASGRDVAIAYVVGLETMHVIAKAASLRDYVAGWHSTITHGTFGAAAATARLLRLDTATTADALSLAHSMATGSKRQFGTSAKPVHAGLAARHGIDAALLAQAGIDAAPDPIFGHGGYLATYARRVEALSDASATAPAAMASVLADDPEGIHQLWRKPYPCCASTHAAIDAVLSTVAPQRAQDLTGLEVLLNPLDAGNLPYTVPRSASEARFSLPYCLAVAATRGRVTDADFAGPAGSWRIPNDVEQIRRLVTMTADDTFIAGGELSGQLRATWADGTSTTVDLGLPSGHPERPLPDHTIRAKLARAILHGTDAADLISAIEAMLEADNVHALSTLLATPAQARPPAERR